MNFIKKINQSNIQYILLFLFLSFFLIWSLNFDIPTENLSVGIGANELDIGDGKFYLEDPEIINNGYWEGKYLENVYSNIKPSFLYPFILKTISYFLRIFDLGIYSKTWNICLIFITSCFSFFSLYFIDKAAYNFFGNRVSNISKWLYIINPYTIFYSISGGITSYMVLAVSMFCYIVSNSKIYNKNLGKIDVIRSLFFLSLSSLFISSLRPNGAIYAIIILIITFLYIVLKDDLITFRNNKLVYLLIIIPLIYSLFQIYLTLSYIQVSINIFLDEGGKYFGIEREYLRQLLIDNNYDFVEKFKIKFYLILWKMGDFVSGISDIRDTHSSFLGSINNQPIFPFISRISTGLFYLYPLNLATFASLIYARKIVFRTGLWILIFASLISLLPNLFGYAFSRYLIMFYSPFLISSGCLIDSIINSYEFKK